MDRRTPIAAVIILYQHHTPHASFRNPNSCVYNACRTPSCAPGSGAGLGQGMTTRHVPRSPRKGASGVGRVAVARAERVLSHFPPPLRAPSTTASLPVQGQTPIWRLPASRLPTTRTSGATTVMSLSLLQQKVPVRAPAPHPASSTLSPKPSSLRLHLASTTRRRYLLSVRVSVPALPIHER